MDSILYSFVEKQLIKYKQNYHLTEREHDFYTELQNAIQRRDKKVRDLYLSMGEDVRHRFMNLYCYSFMQKFGFNDIQFNEYDWIEDNYFQLIETIEFSVSKDNACCNKIEVGCGLNGLWAYGMRYSTGMAGGTYSLSVYKDAFASRTEAVNAAIAELRQHLLYGIKYAKNDSCGNYNVPYINAVLKKIGEVKIQQQATQLNLFEQ